MKRTGWYSPDQVPARRGLFERDHRGVEDYISDADRCISRDLWVPWHSVWYVETDDGRFKIASQQHLPWRGLAK